MSAKPARVFSREFKEGRYAGSWPGESEGGGAGTRALAEAPVRLEGELRARRGRGVVTPGRPPNAVARAQVPRRPKRSQRVERRGNPAPSEDATATQARTSPSWSGKGTAGAGAGFFRASLRHVKAARYPNDGSGAAASSPSSKR